MSDDPIGTTLLLVGPGRAGRALVRSWTAAGGAALVLVRTAAAAERARASVADPAVPVRSLEDGRELAGDLLVLAVPDDAIAGVASTLAARSECGFAFHLSGALPAAALAPLSPRASLGSLHPLRAFGGVAGESWREAFVAVEGEEAAVHAGIALCRRLGARPRRLDAAGKGLYHSAATLSAGGVASLLSVASRVWAEAGLDEEEGRVELARLAVGAAETASRLPFAEALTGPVARRDVDTVRRHRDALANRPEIARLYSYLAAETLRRTPGRGREDEIARLLGAPAADGGEAAADSDKKPDTPDPKI
jgi:predicted short-subunit dehydrogenase-like oxidoreductase (DUF2520 family)